MKIADRFTELTQKIVRIYFNYYKETGIFSWRKHPSRRFFLPDNQEPAGFVDNPGRNCRIAVCINGKTYSAHRLIWLWVHGYFPTTKMIHKNGNKLDNRLSNLVCAPPSKKPKKRVDKRTVWFDKRSNQWASQHGANCSVFFANREDAVEDRKKYERRNRSQ